jgi:hypothetical protein
MFSISIVRAIQQLKKLDDLQFSGQMAQLLKLLHIFKTGTHSEKKETTYESRISALSDKNTPF